MLAKTNSCAVIGLDGEIVEVEVDISHGLTAFNVVGLPEKPVQEARERVRSAIRNSGYSFSNQRITVNLAPADLRKEGPAYDLPIAVGILMASGQVPETMGRGLFLGELSLDGRLRHTQGILPMGRTGAGPWVSYHLRPGARRTRSLAGGWGRGDSRDIAWQAGGAPTCTGPDRAVCAERR